MSSLPLGSITDINGFSPADFGDAEDVRPLQVQFDPTGLGLADPYSTLVSNALQRQTIEIKDKTTNPSPTPVQWRRRLREFMNLKNEDLVNTLKKPIGSQSSLSRAEVFVSKFGRPDFNATHPSLQQVQLDLSGSIIPTLEHEMLAIGPSTSKQIQDQVRWLYDSYRLAGEDCLKKEADLKLRLDILDKTYQKVIGFCDLPVNEDSEKLAEAVEAYIKKIFADNAIEEQYAAATEAYRRFAGLRELIQTFRFTDLQDREPLCSICLTESVGFVLAPCGHTYCGNCLKRQTTTCYMCRSSIRDRVKIFFG
jgi:hypothetical protein